MTTPAGGDRAPGSEPAAPSDAAVRSDGAALAQLQVNANSEYIGLGEYQVPKSIAPLSALLFALFVFWLTANRMRMLAYVLCSSRLPTAMVEEIFRLNPPVLNVFDEDHAEVWSPFNGVGVLIINWAVFFGNAIALTSYAAQARRTAAYRWRRHYP